MPFIMRTEHRLDLALIAGEEEAFFSEEYFSKKKKDQRAFVVEWLAKQQWLPRALVRLGR